jgi:hypothetical protein
MLFCDPSDALLATAQDCWRPNQSPDESLAWRRPTAHKCVGASPPAGEVSLHRSQICKNMKASLRRLAHTICPELFSWYRAFRFRQWVRSSFGPIQRLVRERFYPENETPLVLTGPFRGMLYLDETVWGLVPPKWLGAYEIELADIIEEIVHHRYSRILNIGCAEGYYAVGLALRDPACEIFAFDIDPICRSQSRRLASLNQLVDRVQVRGECNHGQLNNLINARTLVLSDIEGYEVVLLDPAKVPKLRDVDLLIEVHEQSEFLGEMPPDQLIIDRFRDSHMIERRVSFDRNAWINQYQGLWRDRLSREEIAEAVDECRPGPQTWLWAKRKGARS